MALLTVGTENDTDIEIYYEDHGSNNIGWTHPDECNKALLEFLGGDQQERRDGSPLAAAGRQS